MEIKSLRALGVLVRSCERNRKIISIDYSGTDGYRDVDLVNAICVPLPNGYWLVIYSNHDNSVDPFSGEVYDPVAWDNEIIEKGTVSANLMVSADIIEFLFDDWYSGDPNYTATYSYAAYGEKPKEFTFADVVSSE